MLDITARSRRYSPEFRAEITSLDPSVAANIAEGWRENAASVDLGTEWIARSLMLAAYFQSIADRKRAAAAPAPPAKLYRASWNQHSARGTYRAQPQELSQAQFDMLTANPNVSDMRAIVIGTPSCPTLVSVLSEQDAHWLAGGAPTAEYLATLGKDDD